MTVLPGGWKWIGSLETQPAGRLVEVGAPLRTYLVMEDGRIAAEVVFVDERWEIRNEDGCMGWYVSAEAATRRGLLDMLTALSGEEGKVAG